MEGIIIELQGDCPKRYKIPHLRNTEEICRRIVNFCRAFFSGKPPQRYVSLRVEKVPRYYCGKVYDMLRKMKFPYLVISSGGKTRIHVNCGKFNEWFEDNRILSGDIEEHL